MLMRCCVERGVHTACRLPWMGGRGCGGWDGSGGGRSPLCRSMLLVTPPAYRYIHCTRLSKSPNTGFVNRVCIPMNVVSSDASQSVIAHLVLSRVVCMCTVRVPVRF